MHCFRNAWHDERQLACCRCSCSACVACLFCVCCFCFAPLRLTFLLVLCPFAGIQRAPGPSCLGPGPTAVVLRLRTRRRTLAPARPPTRPLARRPLTVRHRAGTRLCPSTPHLALRPVMPLALLPCYAECAGMPLLTMMAGGSPGPAPTGRPSAMLSVQKHPRASPPMFWRSRRVSGTLRPTSRSSAIVSLTSLRLLRLRWDLLQAELWSERDHQQCANNVAQERRIADQQTVEDRFERMTSAFNQRLIEFDDRIFRVNENRAGSITRKQSA